MLNPPGGAFNDQVAVTISSTSVGADVYYTLDGSTPNPASFRVNGPVTLTASGWLRATAYLNGVASDTTEKLFTITAGQGSGGTGPVAAPTLNPPGGSFNNQVVVTVSSTSVGADIYYTLDGSTPNPAALRVNGPVTLTASGWLRATAYRNGVASDTTERFFTIAPSQGSGGTGPVAAPTLNPPGGSFNNQVVVTISSTAVGADIYYTLDGSTPNPAALRVNGPVTLTASGWLRATAYRNGVASDTTENFFFIVPGQGSGGTGPVAAPTLNPPGGSFNGQAVVTISSTSVGADVYYTLDGSTPNPASFRVNGPITLTASGWLRATAYRNGVASDTTEKLFTIAPVTPPPTGATLSYPSGPNGCTDRAGMNPANNAAICIVPGEKPPGGFTPPAVGGSYVDPNFGGRVRIIAGPRALHGYSSPSPTSAGNRYTVVATITSMIVDTQTGATVRTIPFSFEGAMWDSVDERYLYYFDENRVGRFDVVSGDQATIADYSAGANHFQRIHSGGTGDMSKDNWMSFYAPAERTACALDVRAQTTYCAALPADVNVDYTTISKGIDQTSGVRYVVVVPANGPFVLYAVNLNQGRLDLLGRGPENVMAGGNRNGVCEAGESCIAGTHSDSMEDAAGNQYLVFAIDGANPCGYSLYSIQLNKGAQMGLPVESGGGMKRLMEIFPCGGTEVWVDYHLGCAKFTSVCVLSTTSQPFGEAKNPSDNTPIQRTAHVGEIIAIRNNGAEIRRLVEHRSIAFSNEDANGYWSTPRAAISPDGSLVIATSNFGEPNQQRVISIETGF